MEMVKKLSKKLVKILVKNDKKWVIIDRKGLKHLSNTGPKMVKSSQKRQKTKIIKNHKSKRGKKWSEIESEP